MKKSLVQALSNVSDKTGISEEWLNLWDEVEAWYGDIMKKETGEKFLKRMQDKYHLLEKPEKS